MLDAVQQDRPRRLEARATVANSLCGSWGCGDGVTTTEEGPSRWRNRASAGSREACPPGVNTVTPIGLDGSRCTSPPTALRGPRSYTAQHRGAAVSTPCALTSTCGQGPLGRWRQVQPEIGLLSNSPPRNPDVVTSPETHTCSHRAGGIWEGTGRSRYNLVDFEAKYIMF